LFLCFLNILEIMGYGARKGNGASKGWGGKGWGGDYGGWGAPAMDPMAMAMMAYNMGQMSASNSWDSGKGSWGGKGKGSKGKGGGWDMMSWGGKGGKGGKGGRKGGAVVKASFEVDGEARYQGKVSMYRKFSGFGFIDIEEKGKVPGDKVFVYWKALDSEDRFPVLQEGLDVEFSLLKYKDRVTGKYSIRAKNVTAAGGQKIEIQSTVDSEKKTFVGSQEQRFTGTLKFYDPKKNFGYINRDKSENTCGEDVGEQIRVELAEVNAGGMKPLGMKDLQVEFGIWKTPKGAYKAYNMTLPGGDPATKAALEHREFHGTKQLAGTVEVWNFKQMWGFIKPSSKLPAAVQKKAAAMQAAAADKNKKVTEELLYFRRSDVRKGERVAKGDTVNFSSYTDDKGAGACDVHVKA